jgi:Bacteriophage minor capsid protein
VLLDAIAAHLEANGHGTVGTSIYKSQFSDETDAAVCVFEYPGRQSDKAFGTTIICENARFQILVRSGREGVINAYSTARTKAEAIYTLLDGAGNLTLSGINYLYIEALQPPFALEKDANGRWMIVCNYEARKRVG